MIEFVAHDCVTEQEWLAWAVEQAVATGVAPNDLLSLASAIHDFVFPVPDAEGQFRDT